MDSDASVCPYEINRRKTCWFSQSYECFFGPFILLSSNMTTARDSDSKRILQSMEGQWKGACTTWLAPGVVADESRVSGHIKAIAGTGVIRHAYEGSF